MRRAKSDGYCKRVGSAEEVRSMEFARKAKGVKGVLDRRELRCRSEVSNAGGRNE